MADHPDKPLRIALLWRGDPDAPPPEPSATRMRSIFAGLAALGVEAEAVIYADGQVDRVRRRLETVDGVMVWVDPISDAGDRSVLDPMLRDLASVGVWVSAHPDVILKMGVKAVLYRTRTLGWGVDTHLYETVEAFQTEFPSRLAKAGPRVLKQNRGNGGIGVWKVELETAAAPARVSVLQARADHPETGLTLETFMRRCAAYFEAGGMLIDQAFQPRLEAGMVRCYLSQDRVVGFSQQSPRSLNLDPAAGAATFGMASGKIMHDAASPPFQALRSAMENDWVPGLRRLLDIATEDLPALWDADFLYGDRTAAGDDTYVLCEINVSAVSPFPETAGPAIARSAVARVAAAKVERGAA